ncbi:homoserine kinase [Halobacillus rhizosphaerae]|uniref:homoserine kinase n=1 Tax=Halobacillus rhizosphaerae TaxID=3064889 RepID=UPI00398B1FF6
MKPFKIKVPATSANLGPGFDSIGIALSKYVTLDCHSAETWGFTVPDKDKNSIPAGKDNLIYKSALYTANLYNQETLPPFHITMKNDVPVARGLGSSSTAVVGGIEIANQILNLQLTAYEKLKIACEIEGHPDNVAPAIYGGIVVSSYDGNHLDFVHFTKGLDELTWLAIIPEYHLETEQARALLPLELNYKKAVHASGTANVLVAALAQQNWKLAGKMMLQDQWHQPYRKEMIPGFDQVTDIVRAQGALGLYLSGAGPTMIALFDTISQKELQKIKNQLSAYEVEALKINKTGAEVNSSSLQSNGMKLN